jgi:signal transduction histidine kinase
MASQRLKREYMPEDEEKNKEFATLTGVIRDEIRWLNGIIEEFLTFSKSRRLELHDCPVQEVLKKITTLISEEASARGISLRTDWGNEPVVVPMDMDKLQQSLFNFVKNAMESISGDGIVTLSIRNAENGRVGIRVTDTGCGMTTEEVDRIIYRGEKMSSLINMAGQVAASRATVLLQGGAGRERSSSRG